MVYWPAFGVDEREGRLLVGPSPRARRGNRVGLGAALAVFVPFILAFFWIDDAPKWPILAIGVLSVAGGLLSFGQALTGNFELHESRDIVLDRAGDRVVRKGKVVCALSDITCVERSFYRKRRDELALVIRKSRGSSPGAEERVVLLKGADLQEPGSRIAAYLGVPKREVWASGTRGISA
jgi:hypothetical protein